ncbi:MAG: hypothetical protein GY822_32650 [Deltaproteobacteria bacterium]|nr:hypothetical protein [Deltaproteobacteria bacterium]
MPATPESEDVFSFYKAALSAAQQMDALGGDPQFSDDADVAWKGYSGDLPSLIRFELILKNLAALYPAAFAPGPIFQLSGWYDDDAWGAVFKRPPQAELESLWRGKKTPSSTNAALEQVCNAWHLAPPGTLDSELSTSSSLIVAGSAAMAAVAVRFANQDELDARSQILLVSDQPVARQLLGVACAFGLRQGIPMVLTPTSERKADDDSTQNALKEADSIGFRRANLLVTSSDASIEEKATAESLAKSLGVSAHVELSV